MDRFFMAPSDDLGAHGSGHDARVMPGGRKGADYIRWPELGEFFQSPPGCF
jgi:hypothetical protein